MDLTSPYFVVVLIISIYVYYLLSTNYRILYLLILSCSFIASYSYFLLIYILIYSLINFSLGLHIPFSRFKKPLFVTGIVFNLTQLIILKYSSFALDPFFRILNFDFHASILSDIILPVGISFFTLQGIGYLINIKMGWEIPEKRFTNFLLYIIFYPKFLSGPIERSNNFLPQLSDKRSFDKNQVTEGLRMIMLGLLKKIVVADQLGKIVAPVYNDLDASSGNVLWLVILIQPLYLYFDFSGYTDIARGAARTYGLKLLTNFDRPFFSENVTTFWKRFHMSLSLWFNDYVFKQLSFKLRKLQSFASVIAVFITFFLFGIWHGSGWNFMVLGLLQAIAISFEFFTKKKRTKFYSRFPVHIRKWIGRLFTYFFYGLSLVLFFSPNINVAFSFFEKLIHFNILSRINLEITYAFWLACCFAFILLTVEFLYCDSHKKYKKIENLWINNKVIYKCFRWLFYYIIIVLIFTINGAQNDFIYFQF